MTLRQASKNGDHETRLLRDSRANILLISCKVFYLRFNANELAMNGANYGVYGVGEVPVLVCSLEGEPPNLMEISPKVWSPVIIYILTLHGLYPS